MSSTAGMSNSMSVRHVGKQQDMGKNLVVSSAYVGRRLKAANSGNV